MSKNLTRKGLALGAVVALGSTLLAGSPAFAADLVTLAPSAGTTYSTLLGQNFVLSSSIDLSIQAATSNSRIEYKVTNPSAATVALDFGTGSSSTSAGVATATAAGTLDSTVTGSAVSADLYATSSNAATSFYAQPEADAVTHPSTYTHTYSVVADKTQVNNLNVSLTGATATTSVTVQAFIDANGNGTLDSTDTASAAQTVTFVKQSEVTATTVLTTPVLGATSLVGTVTLDNNINLQQINDSAVTVQFKRNNAATGDYYSAGTNAVLNSDKTARVATYSITNSSVIDAATYSAQAIINSANSGSASLKTAAAQTVSAVGQAKATLSANVAADTSNKWQARSGSTDAITFTSALTKTDGTAVAAGVTAHVVVTKVALDATSTITAGGKTFTSTSTATTAEFDVTTDASGNAVFTVTDSTGKLGDKVTIRVTAEGVANANNQTLEFKDAAFKLVNLAGMTGANTEANQTIAAKGSLALGYQVVDQFGVAPTDQYAVTVTRATSTGRGTSTTDAAWSLSANFAAGKASVTIADNGSGVGTDNITSKLYKVLAGGGYASSATQTDTFTLTYAVAADVTPTAVTAVLNNNGVKDYASQSSVIDGTHANTATGYTSSTADDYATNPLAIEAKALTAIDTRVQNTNVPAYAANNAFGVGNTAATAAISSTANEQATLSGVVSNVAGGPVAGVPVTISGSGLLFVYTGADNAPIYAVGSITVLTGTSGDYSVSVLGQITGKAAITVTSGSATAASAVTFGSASAATIALALPTSAQTGRAVDVVASLADKYGNIVKGTNVTLSSTGVGYLSNTAATATGSAGTVSAKLIAGAGETGDAVVTATFTNSDGNDVTVSKTITFGATDAQVDIVNNRVTAVASFTKGKTVAFYVDGIKKWSKASASDADVVLNYNLKKGTHTVTVKISGGFVTTEKFIVQ